jgi:hypothetical protein
VGKEDQFLNVSFLNFFNSFVIVCVAIRHADPVPARVSDLRRRAKSISFVLLLNSSSIANTKLLLWVEPIHVKDLAKIIANAAWWSPPESVGNSLTVEVGGSGVYTFEDLIYRTTRKPRISNTTLRPFVPPILFHLPVPIALMQAYLFEVVVPPDSPLSITRDQIKLLQRQNIVTSDSAENVRIFHGVYGCEGQNDVVQKALFSGIEHVKSVDDVYRLGEWVQ